MKIGSQRWSEAMERDQDLQTQEAVARVLGSSRSATRRITSHGGGEEESEGRGCAMKKGWERRGCRLGDQVSILI